MGLVDLALSDLVLSKSMSVREAAGHYGRSERTIRSWCTAQPGISVRVAMGAHRISLPLCHVWAVGGRRGRADLTVFLEEGRPRGAVLHSFERHGMAEELQTYLDHRFAEALGKLKSTKSTKSEEKRWQPRQVRQSRQA